MTKSKSNSYEIRRSGPPVLPLVAICISIGLVTFVLGYKMGHVPAGRPTVTAMSASFDEGFRNGFRLGVYMTQQQYEGSEQP